MNPSPAPVDLKGWMIADKAKNKCKLSGVVKPGTAVNLPVSALAHFSNKGGIITLLNLYRSFIRSFPRACILDKIELIYPYKLV